ncbi:MAG: M67 family metallopeptidase [Candidatus Margulisbacteria bacterium]|jgi:proteasome lid subunit RPN8/RPN11|nr:M67 family metallopeptidase [Candidatus Margulisiibacteriota bacterium]
MLSISRRILAEIYAHGLRDRPLEACGYLAGRDRLVCRYYPLTNVDKSPEHFTLDPAEQFAAVRSARQYGCNILAVAHTHPASPARPSPEDIRLAYDPDILYVIYSLLEPPTVKAFSIRRGQAVAAELNIEE